MSPKKDVLRFVSQVVSDSDTRQSIFNGQMPRVQPEIHLNDTDKQIIRSAIEQVAQIRRGFSPRLTDDNAKELTGTFARIIRAKLDESYPR